MGDGIDQPSVRLIQRAGPIGIAAAERLEILALDGRPPDCRSPGSPDRGRDRLLGSRRTRIGFSYVAEAESVGANAVLNVRFATTSIAVGAAEILAYGSAVKLDET